MSKSDSQTMTLIQDFRNLKRLRRWSKEANDRSAQAMAEADHLEERLRDAERVTEVFRGEPISVTGTGRGLSVWSCVRSRWADIYLNAHNDRTWGLRVRDNETSRGSDNWRGASWPTRRSALLAAKEFVVTGAVPEFNGKKPNKT